MSFYHFISSCRALPTGHFGYPPKIIYQSYAEYFYSDDYRIDKRLYRKLGYSTYFKAEENNCLLPGKVAVYKNSFGDSGLHISHFDALSDTADYGTAFSGHFQYPYNYCFFGDDLAEYLRTYLLPEDRLDIMRLLLGTNDYFAEESELKLHATTNSRAIFNQLRQTSQLQHIIHVSPMEKQQEFNETVPILDFESLKTDEIACTICHLDKPYGPEYTWYIQPCYPGCQFLDGELYF